MDFQNRHGSKPGMGAMASQQELDLDRRERLRKLAMETVDLSKDPYYTKNHLGGVNCRLCLTAHRDEANYLMHTQAKKHQTNLARRAMRERMEKGIVNVTKTTAPKKQSLIIGRPGYTLTKIRDPESMSFGLLLEIEYPEIKSSSRPRHRFISTYEQNIEPKDDKFQYVVLAAEPYENVSFKIPNMPIDQNSVDAVWDSQAKVFVLQFLFTEKKEKILAPLPMKPMTLNANL